MPSDKSNVFIMNRAIFSMTRKIVIRWEKYIDFYDYGENDRSRSCNVEAMLT